MDSRAIFTEAGFDVSPEISLIKRPKAFPLSSVDKEKL